MPEIVRWGPDNPHPLSQMRTELVWEGKYDEYGRRRSVDVAGASFSMQKIETVDMPMGLLKWCLDYAKNPKTPPSGIFSAVKAAFVEAVKTDLPDTVDRISSFGNEYIAHQEKELVDREVARQAVVDWILGLRRIWRAE